MASIGSIHAEQERRRLDPPNRFRPILERAFEENRRLALENALLRDEVARLRDLLAIHAVAIEEHDCMADVV